MIKDHHEAYITWDEFEKNQRVIANNATGKGSATVKGAVRRGELLLAGLLRCGHCGRKLHVSYSGKLGRYSCYGARTNHGTERCISISGLSIDAAVGTEVLRILKPLGIDAAVKAIETQTSETSAAQRQLELSLIQPPQPLRASGSCAQRSTRSRCARKAQSSTWFCTGRAETTLHYRSS